MTQYTDKNGTPVTVDVDTSLPAYVIREENGEVAGAAHYREKDGERFFYHTVVDERFGGRGLGTALVRGAVEATRAEGLQVVAVCPLVKSFLEKNADEFAGAYRLPSPRDLTWLQGELGQG